MKRVKFFDLYQILALIIGEGCFIASNAVMYYISIYLTWHYSMEQIENGEAEPPLIASYVYTFLLLVAIIGITWFVVRAITYKSRRNAALEVDRQNSCIEKNI